MPEATIVVVMGGPLRNISDLAGQHVCRFDGSEAARKDLRRRLISVGCRVALKRRAYLKAGTFDLDDTRPPFWERRYSGRFTDKDDTGLFMSDGVSFVGDALKLDALSQQPQGSYGGQAFVSLETTYGIDAHFVADIRFDTSAASDLDENGKPRAWVGVEVRGRGGLLGDSYLVHIRDSGEVDLAGPGVAAHQRPLLDAVASPLDGSWHRLDVAIEGRTLHVKFDDREAERRVTNVRPGTVRLRAMDTVALFKSLSVDVAPAELHAPLS